MSIPLPKTLLLCDDFSGIRLAQRHTKYNISKFRTSEYHSGKIKLCLRTVCIFCLYYTLQGMYLRAVYYIIFPVIRKRLRKIISYAGRTGVEGRICVFSRKTKTRRWRRAYQRQKIFVFGKVQPHSATVRNHHQEKTKSIRTVCNGNPFFAFLLYEICWNS